VSSVLRSFGGATRSPESVLVGGMSGSAFGGVGEGVTGTGLRACGEKTCWQRGQVTFEGTCSPVSLSRAWQRGQTSFVDTILYRSVWGIAAALVPATGRGGGLPEVRLGPGTPTSDLSERNRSKEPISSSYFGSSFGETGVLGFVASPRTGAGPRQSRERRTAARRPSSGGALPGAVPSGRWPAWPHQQAFISVL